MLKTTQNQYDELSATTIELDKKIDFLNKVANSLGANAKTNFLKSIECLMDAKQEIENLKEDLKLSCSSKSNFNAWAD